MKVALLVCDRIKEPFRSISGEYVDMYQRFLPHVVFQCYYVCEGQFPDDIDAHQVYICTGSSYSVYDNIDWIKRLEQLVRHLFQQNKKIVGICFGHQMVVQALGGKVEKSKGGWCVGVHSFEIHNQQFWMSPSLMHTHLLMLCQDQVSQLPKGADILSSSPLCPVGMYQINNQVLALQAHPEFDIHYMDAILIDRRDRIGEDNVFHALQSFTQPLSNATISQWIMSFIK